jgi:phosphatidylglycerophosphatase A
MSPHAANSRDAPAPTPFRRPLQFLAFGFGSGLSPWAPGTAGTLVAVPLYIGICGAASRELKVHDHPGIVWDEFVGYWITLWAIPFDWVWMLAGFVVFRVFDIVKPWPIGHLDRKVKGGFGIMVDDILAGIMACATLHLALWIL